MLQVLPQLVGVLALAADEPTPKPTPEQARSITQQGFGILMVLTLLVVVLLCLALWMAMRRMRALEQAQRQIGTMHSSTVSAWEEAGKRAKTPKVEDLERQARGEQAVEGGAITPSRAVQAIAGGTSGASRPIALVTGATRRVGRAIALELARSGCDVLFTYRSSDAEAEALARELAGLGAEATSYRVDLGDLADVERFGDQLAQTLPRLDVLVHNAAAYEQTPVPKEGGAIDLAAMHQQFAVNAMAPLVLTARVRGVLDRSRLLGGAGVVAIGDIHAMGRPREGYAAYAMSKAALIEMVHGLARELAPKVRVNGIAPGVIAWQEREEPGTTSATEQAKYLRRIPLQRFGTPEDAAGVVRWLALEATYVTGQILRLDGGRWLT